nr:MAG TPA: hypothetical protein [Caudoviricetes sp.]DAX89772.1 MAG TPA: hypothetical protein [Caudoviricetes sp.]
MPFSDPQKIRVFRWNTNVLAESLKGHLRTFEDI